MKILITGAKGFVGKNLVCELYNRGYKDLLLYDIDTSPKELNSFAKECNFVIHLAGVNRPADEKEFDTGNRGFTSELLGKLIENRNFCPFLISSSIQALNENPYGRSKKAGEDEVIAYSHNTGAKVFVYRLPNVFGKWCRPNYNSGVATFCHNIARGLEIKINDAQSVINLVYIDDVVTEFINSLENKENRIDKDFCAVKTVYTIKLGELAEKLYSYKKSRENLIIPSFENSFDKALYATYLSYLPENEFSYDLEMKNDNRGWLSEFIKSKSFGQIFISKTKPGITRGNHWHHTKAEKFLVIEGKAVIKFRKIDSENVIEYNVSGEKLQVLDIPAGFTHSIENTGDTDVITLFWADEMFNKDNPDTYYLEV